MRKRSMLADLACVALCVLAWTPKSMADEVWAAEVHRYEPGDGAVPGDGPADNALGPWDTYHQNNTWYGYANGIGRGGLLELKMELPFGDGTGDDLMVYEVGTSVGGANDPFRAWVGRDGVNYYPQDNVGFYSAGDHSSFDISSVASFGPFLYVRICDADTSGMYDGADIDAVSANHAVPEPAAVLLAASSLGCALGALRRRRARRMR